MKFPKLSKRNIIFILIIILILVFGIGIIFHTQKQNKIKKEFLESVSTGTYDSIFLSQYSLANYSAEDFETFRGVSPLIATYKMKELSEISTCLKVAFESENYIEDVYLGVDPEIMWKNAGEDTQEWLLEVGQELCTIFVEHPDVDFEILLYYPEVSHWIKKSNEDIAITTSNITTLATALSSFQNVEIYFPGKEEWLIANPANYCNGEITAEVSQKLVRYVFCDKGSKLELDEVQEELDDFANYIVLQIADPNEYPDLSDWHIVFFGDSIMGNYKGSMSIPGVVNGLSNAQIYNYGKGGTPAVHFLERVRDFENHSIGETRDKDEFPYDDISSEENKLCFVIHYGLNDYFGGAPVDNLLDSYDTNTYAGCLRSGIKQLKESYPNAKIILMPPPFTITFTNGTEIKSAEGGVLVDYVDAAISVAEEMNVICLESYYALNMNEDNEHIYLADGCHYNEYGRFLTGSRIVRMLKE